MFGFLLTGLLAFLLLSDTIVKSNMAIKRFILHPENLIRDIFALVPKFYLVVKCWTFPWLINNLFCRCSSKLLLGYPLDIFANEFGISKASEMVSNISASADGGPPSRVCAR
jgi:hypothetical protein